MKELQRILYVDDEPDIRAVARLTLEGLGGFLTCICESGEQALSLAPDFAPDLILLDVMMPGMDGPATMKRLSGHPALKSIPVVFMTAKVQPSEIRHYMALGAIDVIAKPFDPLALPDRVRAIWEQSRNA